jgi:hypothetical protein
LIAKLRHRDPIERDMALNVVTTLGVSWGGTNEDCALGRALKMDSTNATRMVAVIFGFCNLDTARHLGQGSSNAFVF